MRTRVVVVAAAVVVLSGLAAWVVQRPDQTAVNARLGPRATSDDATTSSTEPGDSESPPDGAEPTSTTETTEPSAASTTTTTVAVGASSDATSGNLTITASVPSKTAAPSEFVAFATHIRDEDGDAVSVTWDFGDGRGTPSTNYGPGCPVPGPEPEPRRIDTVDTQDHAYRKPGTYRAIVTVTTGPRRCVSRPEPAGEQVSAALEIVVTDGTVHSNGPRAGDLKVGQDWGLDGAVRLYAFAYEEDGYIERLEIDWGDGSDIVKLSRGFDECRDDGTAWNASYWGPEPEHRYGASGAYEVTVTFTSFGCDEQDAQTTKGTVPVESPGRQYTSTTTPG